MLDVTPTYLAELERLGFFEDPAALPGVLLVGGEPTPPEMWAQLAALEHTLVRDLYGPTEATVDAYGWAPDGPARRRGFQVANTRTYVLDDWLAPVPPGVPGELYVGGAGVALGYLNRPARTAERFVADPFGPPGSRLYRTGDRARWRRDGVLELLGRTDDQVKIRGFRIEPGEIEVTLAAHPAVNAAAVIVREDRPGDRRLVAYAAVHATETEPGAATETEPGELRTWLAERLPSYLVPAAVVVMAALPLTANNKLDRRALPAPEWASGAGRAPSGVAEVTLADLFAELLGLESGTVGADDDFFALGGHSLLAARLVARIRAALGAELGVRAVFDRSTVAGLAAALGSQTRPGARPPVRRFDPPADGRFPLSAAQARLWFLYRVEGPSPTYNIPLSVRFRGPLDIAALEAALADVVERHETLRTVFPHDEGDPYQRILPAGPVPLPVVDCAEDDLEATLEERAEQAFDLAVEPPLQATLLRLGTDDAVLSLVVHHIASDEASDEPLFADLATAYEARRNGRAPGWDPLPVTYTDYARWQAELLEDHNPSGLGARQAAFWRDALAGLPEELTLPTDRPRPARPSHRGGTVRLALPGGVGEQVAALARATGATPFMVVHAAVAGLLSRLGAGEDIPLGVPVAGRADRALDGLVGFFVNTLVLRADLSGDPSLVTLVDRLRETDLAAFSHEDLPFERVVEVVNPVRSPARHPLFGVMLSYQHSDDSVTDLGATAGDLVDPVSDTAGAATAKFDLSFDFFETTGDGAGDRMTLDGSIDYAADLFDRASVAALGERLGRFLTAALADPTRPLSRIDVLDGDERRSLLRDWNRLRPAPDPVTFPEVFAAQVTARPDATAVVMEDEQLTYGALAERARRLAHALVESGAGPERIVALALPRSLDLVVALVATMEAGAAYLALDPDYPAERLELMLDDAGPVVMVTNAAVARTLPDVPGRTTLVVDETATAAWLGTRPTSVPVVGLRPDHPAYVIYTSGSTGRPKGVVVPHAGVAKLIALQHEVYGVTERSRVLQFASPSFDLAFWEVCQALCSGGTLVLVPPERRVAGAALTDYIAAQQITHLALPPSVLTMLPADAELPGGVSMLCGTEAVPGELVRRFAAGRRMFNAYGPTEATVNSTLFLCPADHRGPVPIGAPDPHVRAYVLDRRLGLVPPGTPGELYLGGEGIARGYLGQPGLTAARFLADPFGPPGSRLYRTGDRARWNRSGLLEFLGRVDDQVKIRGFRIEPAEIEAALEAHPGVGRAIVVARDDQDLRRLVAYVTATDSLAEPGDIRAWLADRLPSYMVPAAFVVLDAFPLTANNKVDRASLPAPAPAPESAGRRPAGPTEEILAAVFAEVLGLAAVGLDDDFFALGGHSLLAARLIGRIRASLGLELPIRALFESPTVAGLVGHLSDRSRPPLRPISESGGAPDGPRPLSPAQARLWFLYRLDGPSPTYNIPTAVRFDGRLDHAALQGALADLVRRHDTLRTVFPDRDGVPHQVVLPVEDGTPALAVVDGTEASLDGILVTLGERRIDLAVEPPVKATVVRLDSGDDVLSLVVHHIASDEASDEPLWRDLTEAYQARRAGRDPDWEPLPVTYRDYTVWHRRLLGDPADPTSLAAEQVAFWRTTLAGAPEEIPLPVDRPRPGDPTMAGGAVPFSVPADVVEQIGALSRSVGATPFMVVHAAVAGLLSRLGSGEDIPLGVPVAGRLDEALEGLVGFFVNTLVLRTDLSGDPTLRQLLARVRAADLAALAHQDLPFEMIVDAAAPTRSAARHPLFQVMISYQHGEAGPGRDGALDGSPVETDETTAKFDLSFDFFETPSAHEDSTDEDGAGGRRVLDGVVGFSCDLFDPETVERLAGRLVRLLAGLVADPDRPLSRIEILDDDERRSLLGDWNRLRPAPDHVTFPEVFGAQVAARPDSVAVALNGEQLTYRELAARAGRLARALIEAGAGPDRIVAVALPRSFDLVVGLVAAMAAGAAYLALDPDYPPERLALMLDDADPVAVVTNSTSGGALPGLVGRTALVVDDPATAARLATLPEAAPAVGLRPDHAAYVIYTSGSTGRPKGVVVPHAGVAKLIDLQHEVYGVTERSRVLQFASPSFDLAFWELCQALCSGGTLVLVPPEHRVAGVELTDYIAAQGVTHLALPPSVLTTLPPEAELPAGVSMLCGTEAVPGELVRRFAGGRRMFNAYGPTEATVNSTLFLCPADHRGPVPIGAPDPHVRAYVLDGRLGLVPPGTPGELYLGGEGLARGYLHQPGLTAARFVADPFGPPGGRLYRTGDRARWNHAGQLEFLGRVDDQVKIRGFRIEPAEIEAALEMHPGVGRAVVVAREDEGVRRLVAYVTGASAGGLHGGPPPREPGSSAGDGHQGGIRAWLAERLPGYMVPAVVVVLDAFPLTPNSKIDRAALPAPVFTSVAGRAPRDPSETVLCEVAAEILHLDAPQGISIDDNFFDLGGDSILSIALVSRARLRGVNVTPRSVFEASTFAALAALAGASPSALPVETAAGRIGPVPPTPMVAWLRHVAEVEGGAIERFNQSEIFQVPAGATLEIVTAVVQTLLDQHEMLRARLVRTADAWTLDVPPPGAVSAAGAVRHVPMTPVVPAAFAHDTLVATLEAEGAAAAGRLDPDNAGMLQAVWLDRGATQSGRLLLVIHHLAVDIVSWAVIADDLAGAADGWAGDDARPPAPSTSFRRYAGELAEAVDRPAVQSEIGYWQQVLADPGPVVGRRPLDPAVDRGGTTDTVAVTVGPEVAAPLLRTVPAAFHAGVTDVLLTGLALALARWQGSTRSVVDLERHGRDLDGLDLTRTVGWHTARHPARLDLAGIDVEDAFAGGPAAGAALKAVKEQLRAVPAAGRHYGLLRWLDPVAAARLAPGAGRPGVQISFNYGGRRAWDDGGEPGDWAVAGDDADVTTGNEALPVTHALDINAEATDGPDGPELEIGWTWPAAVLDRADVDFLARLYTEALRALAAHAATPGAGGAGPSDFPLVRLTQTDLDDLECRVGRLADVVPVTPLQEGFFFHAQLEDGLDAYLPQTVFDLSAGGQARPVDAAVLRRSVEALLERHPNLGAGFVLAASGTVVSVVPREAPVPWREVDLTAVPEAEQTQAMARLAEEDLAAGFDLGRPPLLRLTLARLGGGRARLVITTHHVLVDGWSLPVLYRELALIYDAGGDTSGLEPARPFRDYLAWLAGRDPGAGLAAWREALAGLEGPTLVAPGLAPGAAPRTVESELPEAVTAALTEAARRRRLTVNSVVGAAWAAVLEVETGRNDVVFGATVAGRPAELDGVDSMIGLFINTVPVRARIRPADSLLDLAGRLQADQARLLDHHHLRLSGIVRAAAGVDELFDTLVAFENFPDPDPDPDPDSDSDVDGDSAEGLTLEEVAGRDVTHYPLHLSVSPGPALAVALTYRADRWSATAARSILDRFTRLLTAAAADPDVALTSIDPLSAEERRRALVDWNDSGPATPEVTFPAVFEAHAAATPDATAIVLGDEQLTYRELNERANRLARLLVAAGAGPETVVAVALPRSVDLIAALLAVLKSGAAYLPLDPDYPADRLALMVADAAPVAVVTTTAAPANRRSAVPPSGTEERRIVPPPEPPRPGRTIALDDPAVVDRLAGLPARDLTDADRRSPLLPGHPAYLIYTSGSTGRPKGVVVPHAGVAKLIAAQTAMGVSARTRGLQYTSVSFDVSFWELVRAFGHGGCLVVVPAVLRLPGPELVGYIAAHGVTDLDLPPSVLAALPADLDLPGGVTLVCGGEAVPPEVVSRFAGGRRMFDAYGPTEATVYSTIWECPPDHSGPVLIGRPAAQTTAYVLDRALRLCPPGVTGELYVGGAGLARGYHRQPGLTAARFVADPYGPPGARLYRTGDRARWIADGNIEFLGRADDQVKVRGFRIEPGEVEAVLESHAGVGRAVVVARNDDSIRRLVAYVTPAAVSAPDGTPAAPGPPLAPSGDDVDPGALRALLARRLPAYMVPAAVVVLEVFPLTPNGKVDRAALPAPVFEAGSGRAARDEREAILCRLFGEVLGVDGVTIDDNFFDLGGDSILSIQLVGRVRRAGIAITPRQVFETATVAELVAAAGDSAPGPGAETAAERVGPVPTTPIIAWLRHGAEVRGGSIEAFNQSQLFQVPAAVTGRRLRRVLDGLARKHEALRARLVREPDAWTLDIPAEPLPAGDVLRRVPVDPGERGPAGLAGIIEAEGEAAARRLRPDAGVMVQAVWFDLGADRPGRLLLVVHHLVVDIVSWSVIGDDLADLGTGGEVAPSSTSLRTYARRLADHTAHPDVGAELPYWEDVLSGADPLLGRRALDPAVDVGATMDTLSVSLAPDVAGPLLGPVPAAFHAGVDDVLLGALALAVGEWRRRAGHDVPAGCLAAVERHGRDADALSGLDLSATVGWFTAISPLRLDLTGIDAEAALAGLPAAGAVLKAVKEQRRTVPAAGFHYGLLRWLDPTGAAALGARPEPQILFNYGGRRNLSASGPEDAGDWAVADDDVELGDGGDAMAARYVLEINAEATDTGAGPELEVAWAWPPGVLDRADVETLAGLYLDALRGLVAHAATPGAGETSPSDFPLVHLTEADVDDLEVRFGPPADVLPATPLQEGFFFHSILEGGHDPYLPQIVFDVACAPWSCRDGQRVDPIVLRRSIEALLERHPNLRAGFCQLASGTVVSVVPREAPVPWREVHLAAVPAAERAAAVARLAAEDLAYGFDLSRPPLLRATLVHLDPAAPQLILTSHHALMDGWSAPIFFEELTRIYDAGGDASGLEPVRAFRDYLAWLAGQDPDAAPAAWREALAGLEGPTLVAPGLPPGPAPRLLEVEIPAPASAALTDAARRRHLTVNSMVQTAWAAELGLATGRDDVVFGATVAGRPPELDGIESMVGLFINTVPVRVRLRLDEPLLDTAARVQADQARLLDHHHLGLSRIIRAAAGAGDLFDTLVAFENFPDLAGPDSDTDTGSGDGDGDGDGGGGLTLDEVDVQDVTHYPLTLIVTPGDAITVGLRYRADHWSESDARGILDRVVGLMTAAVADPDVPLAAIDPLTPGERLRALVEWNATGPASPEVTFPAVFEAHALATPDAVAAVCEDNQLTYRELNERANRLARLLVAAGAGPETVVAVALPRSLELITALVAVLKTGAAYLALDPDYPADRLRRMLADAAPAVAVSSLAVPAATRPRPAILLDDPATTARLATQPAGDLTDADRRAPLRPGHAAYVIYTSGSTGRPKGVVVPHSGVAKLIATQTERLRITGHSRVLQFASPSFDLAFWELVQAFGSGACLVVVPAERRVAGPELTRYLADQRVTHLALPPSVLTMLPADTDLPAGSTLLCGTEAVPPEVVARFSAGRRMFNAYGPTEATVNSTLWECPPGHRGTVPIGHPDPQVTAYVLDGALRLCRPGTPGELYVGGAGLARGYHRRPGLTAERFVADPYGPPGARLYRTGDRARWRADGAIEFLGRVDDQVKVRGFRIEPGEIEAVLEAHPGVGRAVVVARDDAGVRRLVGYVTAAAAGSAVDPPALRAFVAERLPGYMVPAAIVLLDAFPLGPTNKVDRDALPGPDFAALVSAREPVTTDEQTLAALFAEVLGLERVGVDDDFFALGGHSLLAARLVTRIRGALGREVPLRDLFDTPTVAGLAARLPAAGAARSPLLPRPRPGRLPLAPVQRGLWALHRQEGPSPTYNIASAVRFRGELDHDALWRALGDLVERHEPLRTAFPCDGDGPYQLLLPATAPLLPVEPCRPDRVDDRLARLATRRFDLTREAPFQAHVLRVGDREHVVSLVVHHIVSDGWSEGALVEDLVTAYEGRRAGRAPGWSPLPVSYADYTLWHQETLDGGLADQQLAYWREALAGLPDEIPLPAARPRPARPDRRGGSVDLDIPPELHRRLRRLAAARGTTLFMVTVAALAALLQRHGAGCDIPVGTQVAGRSDEALDRLVGFFVNIVVVRADLTGDPTFDELLGRVRDRSLSALAHADVPFRRVVADLDPPRHPARNPLFQVMLTYHNIPDPDPHVDPGPHVDEDGVDAELVTVGGEGAWFDLAIDLNETAGRAGVDGTLRYEKARFSKAGARRLAAELLAVLDAVARDPARPLSELPGGS